MTYKVTLIPGDGVGPEVTRQAIKCIEATGAKIEWEKVDAGEHVIEKYSTPLPENVLDSIRKNKTALKGPIITPVGEGFRSVNVTIRKRLGLYACVRPCKLYPGVKSNYKQVDIVVVRENTEDLYAGIEFELNSFTAKQLIEKILELTKQKILKDSAISIKPISQSASERIIRFAFEYAVKNNRRKVTCVHKANIMKYTDGLFLDVARKIAQEYEGKIIFEDKIIDNMCMQLIQKPQNYDVIVTTNLYGDILSDLCAGLVGGLGVAPGANIGDDIAVFEPVHGAAPKYTGKNRVNPTAMILSGKLLLEHLGLYQYAKKLETAVKSVISEGKFVTYDLKSERNINSCVGTKEMADAIIKRIGTRNP